MFTSEQFANLPIQELEYHKFVLTADGKIAVRVLGGSAGDMLKSENLAGLTDYAIARSNLEVYSSDEIDTLLTGYALTGHDHSGVYEPVFSKNTGFNKNFGTAAGTVLEGNRDALYEKLANKGQANGYAPLDSGSLIPSMYLPSYVDDVIDVALYASLPVTGESGKIYNVYGDTVSLNGVYRWGGAAYSKISSVSDAVWGHITGTLADQADLVSALAGKAAASHTHVLADLPAISQNHFLGRNSSGSGAIEVLSAAQTRSALSVYSISDVDGFTVKLSGNQTITGIKTFSSAPVVPDSSFAITKITGLQTALDGKASLSENIFSGDQVFGNGSIWSYSTSGEGMLNLGNGSLVSGWRRAYIYHDLTNLIIANQENGAFGVDTNNIRRFTILGNGYVGINNMSPTCALDVYGDVKFRNFIRSADSGAGILRLGGTGSNDDKIYLQFLNASANGNASEVLLTGVSGGNIPALHINANFVEYAEMRVTGSYGANFKLSNNSSDQSFRFQDANNVMILEAKHGGNIIQNGTDFTRNVGEVGAFTQTAFVSGKNGIRFTTFTNSTAGWIGKFQTQLWGYRLDTTGGQVGLDSFMVYGFEGQASDTDWTGVKKVFKIETERLYLQIPSSSSGLPSGAVYWNGNILTRVP